jgi:hypothetical protein
MFIGLLHGDDKTSFGCLRAWKVWTRPFLYGYSAHRKTTSIMNAPGSESSILCPQYAVTDCAGPGHQESSDRFAHENREFEEQEFDLVVLATGIDPKISVTESISRLGIELNGFGFA